jgi:hypothetical protein
VQPFFRADQVILVGGCRVGVDLDPLDLACEPAALGCVAVRDRGAGVLADVGGLVDGEDHRHRGLDTSLADLLTVELLQPGGVLGRQITRLARGHVGARRRTSLTIVRWHL